MNLIGLLFLIDALVFLVLGTVGAHAVRTVRRMGKALFVTVNPKTNEVDVIYDKTRGGVAQLTPADGVEKSIALDGNYGYSNRGRRAFLVDTSAGLCFRVKAPEREQKTTPDTEYLDGAILNLVRKDTRIQQIQLSNTLNLALILKFIVIGLAILVLGVLVILYMVSKMQGG